MTSAPRAVTARFASLATDRPAATYVALTLAASWALWIPVGLLVDPLPEASLVVGGFGPAAAAVLTTRLRGDSVRDWLSRVLDWRVAPRWYLAALGLPVLLGVANGVTFATLSGTFDAAGLASTAPMYPVMVLVIALVGGGQEEFGWRGFALPALQERYGAPTAAVAVGGVWALWHLPLFAFDAPGYADQSFPLYVVLAVGISVLFAWVFNGSGGSVLVTMLLHGGTNVAPNLPVQFAGGTDAVAVPALAVYAAFVWAGVAAVLLWHGRDALSAGDPVTLDSLTGEAGVVERPAGDAGGDDVSVARSD